MAARCNPQSRLERKGEKRQVGESNQTPSAFGLHEGNGISSPYSAPPGCGFPGAASLQICPSKKGDKVS